MPGLLTAVFLFAMLGAFFALAAVDRRAVPPVLATAALVITLGALVAVILPH